MFVPVCYFVIFAFLLSPIYFIFLLISTYILLLLKTFICFMVSSFVSVNFLFLCCILGNLFSSVLPFGLETIPKKHLTGRGTQERANTATQSSGDAATVSGASFHDKRIYI